MNQIEDPIISELFQKRRNVIKTGLERVEDAYETLGYPAKSIPAILVGGTNGKGTTSAFIFNLLSETGMRVGLYTSPHILSFEERVQVSHKNTTSEELLRSLKTIQLKLSTQQYENLSFFEVTTLMAFEYFSHQDLDFIVVEVGMGGRWDATNVLNPIASIIVSIDFDHQDFLGDTIIKIAGEKAGIMRSDRPCFWGGEENTDAHLALMDNATEKSVTLWTKEQGMRRQGEHLITWLPDEAHSYRVDLSPKAMDLPTYLKENYELAVCATLWIVKALGRNPYFCADIIAAHEPLAERRWPPTLWGRYQHIVAGEEQRPVLLDACHNVDGVHAFHKALINEYGPQVKLPALVSILADKNLNAMLDEMREFLWPLILYKQSSHRTLTFDHLAERHRDLKMCDDFAQAWREAEFNFPIDPRRPWVLCGSIYGLGEALSYLGTRIERVWH